MLKRIYLDANAGAPLLPEVREAMVAALGEAANASSVHAEGRRARAIVEAARAEVAAAVGAKPENVDLHQRRDGGGGAGADAAILRGARTPSGRPALCRRDRASLRARRAAAFRPTRSRGCRSSAPACIDLDALAKRAGGARSMPTARPIVALMLANNETGVIHPVAEAARLVKAHGGYVFCDAVQALGRIPVDIGALGVDFLALSAHKIGGPQGAGRAGPCRRGAAARAAADRRRAGAAPPRRHRKRRGDRRVWRCGAARESPSLGCGSDRGACGRSWSGRFSRCRPRRRSSGREAERLAEHDAFRGAGHCRGDRGDRLRPRRHRGFGRLGLLVRQGRGEPCAGGDGRAAGDRAVRHSRQPDRRAPSAADIEAFIGRLARHPRADAPEPGGLR